MTDAAPLPDPTSSQTEHFVDTVAKAVKLRLEAGAHVGDAMMLGASMMEAWVAVHVDGCYRPEAGENRTGIDVKPTRAGDRWVAPFTSEQVLALQDHQRRDDVHPYTCPQHGTRLNVATGGLTCPAHRCDYDQHWSHVHKSAQAPASS